MANLVILAMICSVVEAVEIQQIVAATWNTEWREPGSRDGELICARLNDYAPEIVCLTEVNRGLLDDWGGYTIDGSDDWGGKAGAGRRKVQLWSRAPWTDVDLVGSSELPPGMFVRGVTETGIGRVTVVGLVIPYHLANVNSGRRDRRMWQDHGQCLAALPSVINSLPPQSLVMGDFNQRIPSNWVPRAYQEQLRAAFRPLAIATADVSGPDGRRSVDHIAHGPGLALKSTHMLSNRAEDGREISDHFGVAASFGVGPGRAD